MASSFEWMLHLRDFSGSGWCHLAATHVAVDCDGLDGADGVALDVFGLLTALEASYLPSD